MAPCCPLIEKIASWHQNYKTGPCGARKNGRLTRGSSRTRGGGGGAKVHSTGSRVGAGTCGVTRKVAGLGGFHATGTQQGTDGLPLHWSTTGSSALALSLHASFKAFSSFKASLHASFKASLQRSDGAEGCRLIAALRWRGTPPGLPLPRRALVPTPAHRSVLCTAFPCPQRGKCHTSASYSSMLGRGQFCNFDAKGGIFAIKVVARGQI